MSRFSNSLSASLLLAMSFSTASPLHAKTPPASPLTAQFAETGLWQEFTLKGKSLLAAKPKALPWTLEIYDSGTEILEFVSSPAGSGHYQVRLDAATPEETKWSLLRRSDDKVVAELSAGLQSGSEGLTFVFSALSKDKAVRLDRLAYPVLPLAPGVIKDLIVPIGLGMRFKDLENSSSPRWGKAEDALVAVVRSRYPTKTGTLQMQVMNFLEGSVLGMTPDAKRQVKDFAFVMKKGVPQLQWWHFPDGNGNVDAPYPVRLQAVDGDWYDAAQIYRQWAIQQDWALHPGPLATRDDIPDWFRDLPSWIRVPRDPAVSWEDKCRWPLDWVKIVGAPLAVHWYGWDIDGGPNNARWPTSFPPRPELLKLLKEYHAKGIHVMPYVNARIAALGSEDFSGVEATMVRNRKGELTGTEHWWNYHGAEEAEAARQAGKVVKEHADGIWKIRNDFAVGDISNPLWRQSIFDRTVPLATKYGFDAVYQDQVNSAPMMNLDPKADPGSATRSATDWQTGTEKLYADIRTAWRKEGLKVPLVSEYLGENLMPFIEGALTVGRGTVLREELVPLFPAVYHTHLFCIGWPDNRQDLPKNPDLYLSQRMLPFVLGSQMGWFSYTYDELREKHPSLLACYVEAIKVRKKFPELIAYGKMLRPPRIEGVERLFAPPPDPKRTIIRGEKRAAILGGFFQDPQNPGRALAVFVNWTGQKRSGQIHLDFSEIPTPAPKLIWSNREEFSLPTDASKGFTLEMEPHSVVAILLGEKE